MAPRTLEAVPSRRLTLWALRGLTTLDPRLTAELQATATLRLLAPDRVLVAPRRRRRRTTRAAGATRWRSWRAPAGTLVRAGAQRRHAAACCRRFFDELFNHLDPYSRYVAAGRGGGGAGHGAPGSGGIGVHAGGRAAAAIVVQAVLPDGPARAGRHPRRRPAPGGRRPARPQDADPAAVAAWLAGPEGTGVTLRCAGATAGRAASTLSARWSCRDTVTAERARRPAAARMSAASPATPAARLAQALVAGLAGAASAARHRDRPARQSRRVAARGGRGGRNRCCRTASSPRPPGATRTPAHVFVADGSRPVAAGCRWWCWWTAAPPRRRRSWPPHWPTSSRAVVVGSATLGKGLVQTIAPLPDGGELFVTWSRVLAPLRLADPGPRRAAAGLHQPGPGRRCAGSSRHSTRASQPMAAALSRHRAARAPVLPEEMLAIRNACPAAEGRDIDLFAAGRLVA